MTADKIQPTLPFGEANAATDSRGERPPSQHADRRTGRSPKPVARRKDHDFPPSLAAFASAWKAPTPSAAMEAACADLRARSGQLSGPYALTPMLDVLSATRAVAPPGSGAHGRLHAHRAGWTVYRRVDLPWRRVRFTEAHEIAHILLYEKLVDDRACLDDLHSDAAHPSVEALCDLAATELLVPAADLTDYLREHPLTTIADYHRLYDRYLVSHLTLLRRVAEVTPGTALTVWAWREHRKGANWRVQSSYCQNAPDGVYIPTDISRRRLSPDLIDAALASGVENANASLDVGNRRYTGDVTALYPTHRSQHELPIYHGHAIRDEPGKSVYMIHRNLSSTTLRRPLARRSSRRAS